MTHQIKDFSEKDKTWLSMSLAQGRKILQHFAGPIKMPLHPAAFDQAFMGWVKDQKSFSHEEIANGLGCLFGDALRDQLSFTWKIIDDKYGSEPALIHDQTGSVVFPVNTVWKRIEPEVKAEPFFEPMYSTIASHIKSASAKD